MKLGLIALLILLAVGGYYAYQYYLDSQKEEPVKEEPQKEPEKKVEKKTEEKAALVDDIVEVISDDWKNLSSEERLKIIRTIVRSKVRDFIGNKKANGSKPAEYAKLDGEIGGGSEEGAKEALSAISEGVKSIMPNKEERKELLTEIEGTVYTRLPPEIDREVKLSPELARQLEERAVMEYRLTDEELTQKLSAEAEKMYPAYTVGEEVTVHHQIHGGTFDKVTGKFYRQDADFVWIGNRKIAKSALREEYVTRFDPVQAEQARKKHVEQGLAGYRQERMSFELRLKDEAIHELRGYVRYKRKWLSVRKTVHQVYHDILDEEKSREIINSTIEQAKLKVDKNNIEYEKAAVLILQTNIRKYPNAPNLARAENRLNSILKTTMKDNWSARKCCFTCRKTNQPGWIVKKRQTELGKYESVWVPCPGCNPKGFGPRPTGDPPEDKDDFSIKSNSSSK